MVLLLLLSEKIAALASRILAAQRRTALTEVPHDSAVDFLFGFHCARWRHPAGTVDAFGIGPSSDTGSRSKRTGDATAEAGGAFCRRWMVRIYCTPCDATRSNSWQGIPTRPMLTWMVWIFWALIHRQTVRSLTSISYANRLTL
jgi:hypothetical protein